MLRVGSTDSSENVVIAEIYAGALERARIGVERRMGLGDETAVMAALRRGDIDLFPGHTGAVGREKNGDLTWLEAAPVDDAVCLVTSQYVAQEYWMLSVGTCAGIAGQLRFAGTREFLASGALDGLRRRYGGFGFRKILACDLGEQYDALNRGDVDVANGFATDAKIGESQLIVLGDDKHFWPRNNIAPVMRSSALRDFPNARRVLDRISGVLTQYAVQQMNAHLDLLSLLPSDVAGDFLNSHRT